MSKNAKQRCWSGLRNGYATKSIAERCFKPTAERPGHLMHGRDLTPLDIQEMSNENYHPASQNPDDVDQAKEITRILNDMFANDEHVDGGGIPDAVDVAKGGNELLALRIAAYTGEWSQEAVDDWTQFLNQNPLLADEIRTRARTLAESRGEVVGDDVMTYTEAMGKYDWLANDAKSYALPNDMKRLTFQESVNEDGEARLDVRFDGRLIGMYDSMGPDAKLLSSTPHHNEADAVTEAKNLKQFVRSKYEFAPGRVQDGFYPVFKDIHELIEYDKRRGGGRFWGRSPHLSEEFTFAELQGLIPGIFKDDMLGFKNDPNRYTFYIRRSRGSRAVPDGVKEVLIKEGNREIGIIDFKNYRYSVREGSPDVQIRAHHWFTSEAKARQAGRGEPIEGTESDYNHKNNPDQSVLTKVYYPTFKTLKQLSEYNESPDVKRPKMRVGSNFVTHVGTVGDPAIDGSSITLFTDEMLSHIARGDVRITKVGDSFEVEFDLVGWEPETFTYTPKKGKEKLNAENAEIAMNEVLKTEEFRENRQWTEFPDDPRDNTSPNFEPANLITNAERELMKKFPSVKETLPFTDTVTNKVDGLAFTMMGLDPNMAIKVIYVGNKHYDVIIESDQLDKFLKDYTLRGEANALGLRHFKPTSHTSRAALKIQRVYSGQDGKATDVIKRVLADIMPTEIIDELKFNPQQDQKVWGKVWNCQHCSELIAGQG